MATGISPLQKLQQSTSQMDGWIAAHRPSASRSQEIFTAFMERYGSQIIGSKAFISKTQRVIKKASQMAAGAVIMQRLLDTGHSLSLKEAKTNGFLPPDTLELNFSHPNKDLNVCLNEQQERVFERSPRTSTFIHESLHVWRLFIDSVEKQSQITQEGVLPEMDSLEEELTITGNLHIDHPTSTDFCCENTALRELGRSLRINHRGIDDSRDPDLHDFVRYRITPDILKLSESGLIHNEKKEGLTPLELAMHLYLLENRPEIQSEWLSLMQLLVRCGCHSEYALRLALLLHSKEIILPLLLAGVKLTDEMLNDAIQESSYRFQTTWKLLGNQKWVISDEVIERMSGRAFVGRNSDDIHPVFKMMDKQDKQRATLKAKFSGDETLPIHTLEHLFYFNPLDHKQDFVNWVQSHSYRRVCKSEPVQENQSLVDKLASFSFQEKEPAEGEENAAAVEEEFLLSTQCCIIPEEKNLNFEFTADGLCVPSETHHYTHRVPVCYKQKIITSREVHPYFTSAEFEAFIKIVSPEHIDILASDLTGFLIGYNIIGELHLDYDSKNMFTQAIAEEIANALASPANLLKELDYKGSITAYYVDIAILSENGEGLLTQVNNKLNRQYIDQIQALQDQEAKPVSSIVCRFRIWERLTKWEEISEDLADSECTLCFDSAVLVNGKPIHYRGQTLTGMFFG